MQAEEDAFSVDYDVWIDPITQETKIEKYQGHLSAFECDRCGFQTLKLQKETILKKATDFEDGEIEKEFECTYCGRVKRKTQTLSKNVDKSSLAAKKESHVIPDIEAVKVEIHGTNGETKLFEFQNTAQAKKFLEEFEFKKIHD
jgi:transcription elongation factor Elf1